MRITVEKVIKVEPVRSEKRLFPVLIEEISTLLSQPSLPEAQTQQQQEKEKLMGIYKSEEDRNIEPD